MTNIVIDAEDRFAEDAELASRTLLAVLDHADTALFVDERFFEALLLAALRAIPDLASGLGIPPGLTYELGKRGRQPDLIGTASDDTYAAGIEVKIRSNVNWTSGGTCQLDRYAENAPPDCPLILLVADAKAGKLHDKLAGWAIDSLDRWQFVTLSTLRDQMAGAVSSTARAEDAAVRLILNLARLT